MWVTQLEEQKKNTVSLWVFSDIRDFDIDELGDFDNEDDNTNVREDDDTNAYIAVGFDDDDDDDDDNDDDDDTDANNNDISPKGLRLASLFAPLCQARDSSSPIWGDSISNRFNTMIIHKHPDKSQINNLVSE